jgi:hypothetical protein
MKTIRRQNLLAIARGLGVEPIRTSEQNRRAGNKKHMKTKNKLLHYALSLLTAGAALFGALAPAHVAAGKKPNFLVIWGDDVGWFNISANNNGMMGYKTPNIDRIAKEGANFTDWYGQQSCTAGRSRDC